MIRETAALHDVGKIVIPDSILRKPGPLTPDEFAIMRTHTTVGAEMFGTVTHSETIAMAATIARSHHERWNGSGYPDGLAGEDIPIAARIVSVADVYDALVTNRPYRDALSHEVAVAERRSKAGPEPSSTRRSSRRSSAGARSRRLPRRFIASTMRPRARALVSRGCGALG